MFDCRLWDLGNSTGDIFEVSSEKNAGIIFLGETSEKQKT